MEKNGVSRAKRAKSISAKEIKKIIKKRKKEEKKQHKRDKKNIEVAFRKAYNKQNTEKYLSFIVILLSIAPFLTQLIVDKVNKNKE